MPRMMVIEVPAGSRNCGERLTDWPIPLQSRYPLFSSTAGLLRVSKQRPNNKGITLSWALCFPFATLANLDFPGSTGNHPALQNVAFRFPALRFLAIVFPVFGWFSGWVIHFTHVKKLLAGDQKMDSPKWDCRFHPRNGFGVPLGLPFKPMNRGGSLQKPEGTGGIPNSPGAPGTLRECPKPP